MVFFASTVKVTLDDAHVNVSGGGLLGVYKSTQLHFHWGNGSSAPGSEHTVDGKQYPMEVHKTQSHNKS